MVASLTTPFRMRHPNVQFTILSRTSIEVLAQLENLEIDAGLTYLDNEPLGRVNAVPLYREHYRLLTSSDAPLGNREAVTWAEVAQVPLCLLTPDMQNRRIIDELLRGAGGTPQPTLESNSMIVLFAHVRTGRWAASCRRSSPKRWPHRDDQSHSHRRAGSGAHDRPGRPLARTDDAAHGGARCRGAAPAPQLEEIAPGERSTDKRRG
jgi:Transcriptional regulator